MTYPHSLSEQGSPRGKKSSWLLVVIVFAAFSVGAAALIAHTWPLFWGAVGVVLLSIPVGLAIHIMDDTVEWGTALARPYQPPHSVIVEAYRADQRRRKVRSSQRTIRG